MKKIFRKKNAPTLIKIGVIIFFLLMGLGIFGLYKISELARNLPNPQQSENWQMIQSTKIYDRTRKILLYEINEQGKRTVIPFSDIPEPTKQATLVIEDQGFYEHSALDWKGIMRAFFINLFSGEKSQGGSTLTQQLAKNAFLSPEKTYARKIKEAMLAYWIEKYYSKDKILELYFNQIPYGAGANGIEAASQTYFGKPAKELTLNESATLAAMLQLPSYYSPWGAHINELEQRKNFVLGKMYDLGYIDQEEKERSQGAMPRFLEKNIGNIKAPHFVLMVKDYLLNKYGEDMVNRGGLRVITTLDWNLQQIAEKAVSEGAVKNTELYKGENAALVAQDPKTGQVLALVGSADYFNIANEGNFNVAAQGLRQPGSSIKPFVYVTAFKKGYSPDTVLFDAPTEFSTDPARSYKPENYDHIFRGPINLRNSLAQSINVTAVKTLYLAGLKDTIQTANDFGIATLNDPDRLGLTLVLGGGEVRLIDMVEAYSVFAQDGIKHEQVLVLNVSDSNNNEMEKYFDRATQVIEPQYPRLINDILSDSEARRPLFQNSFDLTVFPDREVALKTGTTDDYKDAWTIGYTPNLAVGVWAGNNHRESMQKSAGSILAAVPIWNAFIKEALNNFPVESFNKPDPTSETKPMLNGQYNINGQIHDILYYVDKNDPLGPVPKNPQNDPQFYLWENPAQNWLRQLR
ncbi:MAG: transglycosylase domain-containing protein [Patescibacteria group bacterium]|nr:transglycosylase domain-containing protein [Patescibacteria group bacterium]